MIQNLGICDVRSEVLYQRRSIDVGALRDANDLTPGHGYERANTNKGWMPLLSAACSAVT